MFVVNYINPLTYEEIKKVFKTKTGSKNNYNSTYRTAYECAKKIHRN